MSDDPASRALTAGCLLCILAAPAAVLALPRSDTVAVIGAPWNGLPAMARLVQAAGGTIVQAGARENLIYARSERDGFVLRLYAAGALLVLDPAAVVGCAPGRSPEGPDQT